MKSFPLIFFLVASFKLFAQGSHNSSDGIFDARHWKFKEESMPLNGPVHFFDHQLLTPAECKTNTGSVINFPELFNNKNTDPGIGFATYAFSILVPYSERDFAIALPQMYSSYKLWINGKVVAENGIVGKTKEECKPQWKPQTVTFQADSDTLNLVLQIANFHHAKGGIKESIYLGEAAQMKLKRTISEWSKFGESGILFLTGLFFLVIFFFRVRNKAVVYFALLCLTWSIRSLFSNLYLFISIYPDFNWATMVRIEYIALYLTMIWAILFLTSLFHNEANIVIKYSLVFCNIIFTGFSVYSSPRVFTQGLNVYLIFSGILLLYGGYIVIRAWINERTGSGLLTITVILALNIFGFDIFVYEGFSSYDPVIFSVGYVSIFLLMSLALAAQIKLIKSNQGHSNQLTYDDLYRDQL